MLFSKIKVVVVINRAVRFSITPEHGSKTASCSTTPLEQVSVLNLVTVCKGLT